MKRIAITGATGFLGFRTAKALSALGHDVTALGRSVSLGRQLEAENIRFVRCELSDLNRLKQTFRGHDCVVHCAALTRPGASPDDYRISNVIGTQNVMQAMAGSSVRRWIHLSSARLYGGGLDRLGVNESAPLAPAHLDPYLESKRRNEIDIDNFVLVPAIILRPHLIFGPGDRRILPFVARFARWNRAPRFDLGESMIDPVYVDNVVDAIAAAIESADETLGRAYNISNGTPVENYTFISTLAEISGGFVRPFDLRRERALRIASVVEAFYRFALPEQVPFLPASYVRLFSESLTLNADRARDQLGFRPKISLRDGIQILSGRGIGMQRF